MTPGKRARRTGPGSLAALDVAPRPNGTGLSNSTGSDGGAWTPSGRELPRRYALAFESFARYVFGDLGYTLEIERFETTAAGADELTPAAPRVTSVFCRAEDVWKLSHRHADTITTIRPGQSALQP